MRHTAEVIVSKQRSYPTKVTTVGLELAKDVFQVHGVTADGAVAFNRTIRRAQVMSFF